MAELYRRVNIVNGETAEPVHFVGIHPVAWGESPQPTVGFVEYTGPDPERLAEALIILAYHPSMYYVNEVNDDGIWWNCNICHAQIHGTYKNIQHAQTCPVGQAIATLAAWDRGYEE